ncbi:MULTISPECIES: hypothetical protein [unclassified Streptomyces]|uniref:hypothetical protein n=1 Tax=unclassified Streptomyces TaxID=2593676 RepID=UPI002DD9DA61|nr:hypothetical protein [Streptomyces sp. NBC_00151]WRZ40837.1 hypothetical protein OG915_23975 [Streptomyces sp. NBC_00151]
MHGNTSGRRSLRRIAAVTAGLALGLGLGVSAHASQTDAPHRAPLAAAAKQRTVSGKADDALTGIADFYGAYIDAQNGSDPNSKLMNDLRAHYLDSAFSKKLAAWERTNHADGVLRAQSIPARWTVTEKSKGDSTEAVVTLSWSMGGTVKLSVVMTPNHRIVSISPAK